MISPTSRNLTPGLTVQQNGKFKLYSSVPPKKDISKNGRNFK
jgi:hypothetical protein